MQILHICTLYLHASLCQMWTVSQHPVNIAPLSCSKPSKQTNKMVKVDIKSHLNLNGDFNLSFTDNELNQYLVIEKEVTAVTDDIAETMEYTSNTAEERARIHNFIDKQKKINTIWSTKRDLKLF